MGGRSRPLIRVARTPSMKSRAGLGRSRHQAVGPGPITLAGSVSCARTAWRSPTSTRRTHPIVTFSGWRARVGLPCGCIIRCWLTGRRRQSGQRGNGELPDFGRGQWSAPKSSLHREREFLGPFSVARSRNSTPPDRRGRFPKIIGSRTLVRATLRSLPSIMWGREVAEAYDATSAALFDPAVLDPTVELLDELARGGPALELAVGTGRVALPLVDRGLRVSGIELSPYMVEQLRAKPGAEDLAVTIGDMTTARMPGAFTLVFLVCNTIMNVTTQDEQVAVFINAAAHLALGGLFVVEVVVPRPLNLPVGEIGRVFTMEDDHVGIDTFDDLVGQISSSH